MFYNHLRQRVGQWDGQSESQCPTCAGRLIPKRGDSVRWHWAHYPGEHARRGCPYEESAWHLRWKAVYLAMGWAIEMPVVLGHQRYIVDAMHQGTGRIREFVHSLSATYLVKHAMLRAARFDVGWIFDGEAWSSLRATAVRKGGRKHLLKPRAYDIARNMHVLVHTQYPPAFWRHWKENIWFPVEGDSTTQLLASYAREGEAIAEESAIIT